MIRGEKGKYVVFVGDSVYTQCSIKEYIIPGFTVDNILASKSVGWICACAADENCLLTALNHDPEIKEQVIG